MEGEYILRKWENVGRGLNNREGRLKGGVRRWLSYSGTLGLYSRASGGFRL